MIGIKETDAHDAIVNDFMLEQEVAAYERDKFCDLDYTSLADSARIFSMLESQSVRLAA